VPFIPFGLVFDTIGRGRTFLRRQETLSFDIGKVIHDLLPYFVVGRTGSQR